MIVNNVVRSLVLTLASFVAALSVHSQLPSMSATEREIRKLDQEAAKAVLEKDEGAIKRFFTQDSVTNNPRGTLTRGSLGVIEAARTGLINYHSFERTVESVQIYGETAIVMGSEVVVMKGLDGGAGDAIKRRYTNVWMKRGKTWRIVARHANVICG